MVDLIELPWALWARDSDVSSLMQSGGISRGSAKLPPDGLAHENQAATAERTPPRDIRCIGFGITHG